MIKLVIFDYDGVIVDSFPLVHEVYQFMCSRLGKHCPALIEDFRKIYGKTFEHSFERLGIDVGDYEKAALIFKKEMLRRIPALFEGIRTTLRTLQQRYPLVVISSNYYDVVARSLKQHRLFSLFDQVIAKENKDHGYHFAKTASIKALLKTYRVKPSEVVLIGDRDVDFIEGRAAGISHIILVEYGWGYNPSLVKGYTSLVQVHAPTDLIDALNLLG